MLYVKHDVEVCWHWPVIIQAINSESKSELGSQFESATGKRFGSGCWTRNNTLSHFDNLGIRPNVFETIHGFGMNGQHLLLDMIYFKNAYSFECWNQPHRPSFLCPAAAASTMRNQRYELLNTKDRSCDSSKHTSADIGAVLQKEGSRALWRNTFIDYTLSESHPEH